jgi:hypothetical protein
VKNHFSGPPRVPASEFEDLEPIVDARGRTRRRVRHKLTGCVGTEIVDWEVSIGPVEVKPMEVPRGSIFFQESKYGSADAGGAERDPDKGDEVR